MLTYVGPAPPEKNGVEQFSFPIVSIDGEALTVPSLSLPTRSVSLAGVQALPGGVECEVARARAHLGTPAGVIARRWLGPRERCGCRDHCRVGGPPGSATRRGAGAEGADESQERAGGFLGLRMGLAYPGGVAPARATEDFRTSVGLIEWEHEAAFVAD